MHAFERDEWLGARWRPMGSSRRACLVAVVLLHAAAVLAWWQLPAATVQRVVPPRVMAMIVAAKAPERPPEIPPRVLPRVSPPKARAAVPNPVAASNDAAPAFVPMPEAPSIAATPAIAIDSAPVVATAPPTPEPATPPVAAPRFEAAYLDNVPPAYPSLARQFREQGVVMLDVRVTPAGRADAVEIRKSSGSTRLDAAARAAVAHWRFVPARQGDTPVTAWVVVPIRFALNG